MACMYCVLRHSSDEHGRGFDFQAFGRVMERSGSDWIIRDGMGRHKQHRRTTRRTEESRYGNERVVWWSGLAGVELEIFHGRALHDCDLLDHLHGGGPCRLLRTLFGPGEVEEKGRWARICGKGRSAAVEMRRSV